MAEPALLLGLDAGNTVIKAVLFDSAGNQLAMSRRDGVSSSPVPGYVERDLNELWSNAATVIRECLDKAGAAPAKLASASASPSGNATRKASAARRPARPVSYSSSSIRANGGGDWVPNVPSR